MFDRHLDDLVAAIDQCDRPLVWIWSWPGSGVRRLVGRLLDADQDACELEARSPAELAGELEQVRARRRRRFVLANGVDRGTNAIDDSWSTALADQLRFGEQAIVAASVPPELRDSERVLMLILGPEDMTLPRHRLGEWFAALGSSWPADAVVRATGGWLAPLQCLEVQGALPDDDRDELGERPPQVEAAADRLVELLLQNVAWQEFVRRRLEHWWPLADQAARGTTNWPLLLQRSASPSASPSEPKTAQQAVVVRTDDAEVPDGDGTGRSIVRARMLGVPDLQIGCGDRSPNDVRVPHRRLMVLLAVLATAEQGLRDRDELLEALWPDQPVDRALRSLRPALSHLRRLVRPAELGTAGRRLRIVARRGRFYGLGEDVEWKIDVVRFRELLASRRELERLQEPFAEHSRQRVEADVRLRQQLERRRDLLAEAWQLYRGEFLAGHGVSPWVRQERERVLGEWRDLLRDLGATHVSLGEFDRALDALRALLQSDPTLEEVHLDVIRIFLLQGRRRHARRQWEKLCERLLFELDSRPLDETVRVYSELMG